MIEFITPFDKIENELHEIQGFLEITMSEEAKEAIQRGNDLAVYMARSGKILADAKYYRDKKLRSEVVDQIREVTKLPPSVANKFIDSLMEKETRLMTWADRINRSCTHQLDWCRSVLSKAKADMQSFDYGNHNNKNDH